MEPLLGLSVTALMFFGFVCFVILLRSFRVINEYERGVIFRLGKVGQSGVKSPGLRIVLPLIDRLVRVDLRTVTLDVPPQEVITKDNVTIKVNAVVYFNVMNPVDAVIRIANYYMATSLYAQTTLRNILGQHELDEILAEREKLGRALQQIIDQATDAWGVKVTSVEIKDIELPAEMRRAMAKQAEAERERRAVIINSEGEVIAAENLRKAAAILAENPAALHLRTLNSINDISSDQSNTVVFMLPMEVLKAFDRFSKHGAQ